MRKFNVNNFSFKSILFSFISIGLFSLSKNASSDEITTFSSEAGEIAEAIHSTQFIGVATASNTAEPFYAIVASTVDEDLNFYWMSSNIAQQSINIHDNSNVFIHIVRQQGSTNNAEHVFNAYLQASAIPLVDTDEIEHARTLFLTQAQQQTNYNYPFLGIDNLENANVSVYKATPEMFYISEMLYDNEQNFVGYTNKAITKQDVLNAMEYAHQTNGPLNNTTQFDESMLNGLPINHGEFDINVETLQLFNFDIDEIKVILNKNS